MKAIYIDKTSRLFKKFKIYKFNQIDTNLKYFRYKVETELTTHSMLVHWTVMGKELFEKRFIKLDI
jgi:hypothetical protein